LPAFLLETSRHALSAPALCCACLLQTEHLAKQWAIVKAQGDHQLLQNVDKLYDEVSRLSGRQKLQLIQIAVPGLKQLSQQQFVEFQTLCQNLSRCDGQEDLLEWTILNWLQHCVGSQFNPSLLHRRDRSSDLAQVQQSVLALLSLCAQQAKDEKLQQQAWSSGLQLLALPSATARPEMSFSQLSEQLPALIHSTPRLKQQLWQMLKIAVQADELVNDQEAMLLQALALLLEIPVSPDHAVA
jgi:hypothetical protein